MKENHEKATNEKEDLSYGYGLAFPTLFGLYIRKLNLRKWTFISFLSGLLIGFVYSLFRQKLASPGQPVNWLDYFVPSITFFLWGFPGFLFVYRKEAIGRSGHIVRGKDAVVYGLILLIICWGLGVYGLYLEMIRCFGW